MRSAAFWAGYYGIRADASDPFVQGYLDALERLDGRKTTFSTGKKIPGKKCGGAYISASYNCKKENTGAGSESAKNLAARARAAKGLKPKQPGGFKPVTGDELGSAEEIGRNFQHMYRNTRGIGKGERDSFQEYVNGNYDRLSKELQEYGLADQQKALDAEMENLKSEYVSNAKRMYNAASGTVSAFIAGGSNFNRKQAARRGSAYDRASEEFSSWKDKAISRVESRIGLSEAKNARKQQKALSKREKEKQTQQIIKEYQKKLKIANDPNDASFTLTREEWKKAPSAYKQTTISDDGTYKYRSLLRGGSLGSVYISDMKESPTSEAAEIGKQAKNEAIQKIKALS